MTLSKNAYTKFYARPGNLSELCAALDAEEASITDTLAGLDYRYDPQRNQFV